MKRGRASSGQVQRRSKRPIDKKLVIINLGNIVAAQQTVYLIQTAAFPGTITGIRWNLTLSRTTFGAGTYSACNWVIVVVPAGTAISTTQIGAGSSLYDPEQNVLAFGCYASIQSAYVSNCQKHFEGSTKSMRKLKNGDNLLFAIAGTAIESHAIFGTIQWFYKT